MIASSPEVEWDDAERQWMLALEQYRTDLLCPCGCGWLREVSMDPMTELRTFVPPPSVCYVSRALAVAQKAWNGEEGHEPAGLLWSAQVRVD